MPARVITQDEVNINGTYFPIIGQVQEIPQNIFPPKRVDGDYTRDSNPRLSSMTWSDFRGGLGLDIMQGNQTNRCWTSSCNIRFRRSLVLAPLSTVTSTISGSALAVGDINEHNSVLFVSVQRSSGNTQIFSYDRVSDVWSSSGSFSSSANSSDAINIELEGTEYLVYGHNVDYEYFDGTSWARSTKDVVFLTAWDDRLWGIDSTGQMWYAFTPGTETNVAKLPAQAGGVLDLFTYRSLTGESIIYALASRGLFAYDAANDRFIENDFPTPIDDVVGTAAKWRGDAFFGSGHGIIEYSLDGTGAVLSLVGPDQDDGLSSDYSALQILDIESSVNEIFVIMATSGGGFVSDDTVKIIARGDQNNGWYEMDSYTAFGTDLYVSLADGVYRLWYANDTTLKFIPLSRKIFNPKQNTSSTYAAAGELRTPWFHADQVDVDKLAIRLKVETADTNSNETVTVSYALDYNDDVYSQFDTITTNGVKIIDFSKWHTYLAFNGTSGLVTVSDATSIQNQFDGGAGISARIYVDSDGENDIGTIFNKTQFTFSVDNESGGAVKLTFGYTFSTTSGVWVSTNSVINIGEFYRVGVDYDNGSVSNNPTIYVYRELTRTLVTLTVGDGLTESTAPVGTRTTDVGSDLIIGNRAPDDRTFDGRIDDFRWYGATGILSTEDKDNELIGNETNLIGYWKFNENTGSTANDSSDLNSNNGTVTTATFAENTDKAGMSFRAIRFKIELARGGTTTKSPRLVSLTLEYRKKLDYKQGFRVQLDLRDRHKEKSPKDLRSALQETLKAKSLVEFTYRNDTGDTRNFWTDTFLQQGLEQTGYNETGTAVVDLLEA